MQKQSVIKSNIEADMAPLKEWLNYKTSLDKTLKYPPTKNGEKRAFSKQGARKDLMLQTNTQNFFEKRSNTTMKRNSLQSPQD